MKTDKQIYVVWAHRGSDSIFGAASRPIVQNGGLLCFKTEHEARTESDRLNARSGSSHVRYSVRPVPIQFDLPGAAVKEAGPEPRHANPAA